MTDLPPSFPPAIPPRRRPDSLGNNPPRRPREINRPEINRPEINRPETNRPEANRPANNPREANPTAPPPSYAPQRRSLRETAAGAGQPRPQTGALPPTIPPRRPVNPASRPAVHPAGRQQGTPVHHPHAPAARPNGPAARPNGPAARSQHPATHPENPTRRPPRGPARPPAKLSPLRITFAIVVVLLVGAGLWVNSLWSLSDSQLKHVSALSGAPNTSGTTYLIAGSDSRDNADFKDDTEGRRSDTIMLLHKAANGQVSLISIPRDSFVNIPGHGEAKINAAYALGGPALLVQTVEALTGLTIDHYVEIGMDGVTKAVDAVDGVELCLDYDVADEKSQLYWKAGCHQVDGKTALAFARMRYADPEGDIGRAKRQREVISAVSQKVFSKETYTSPARIKKIVIAGASSLTTDPGTKSWEIGYLALYFREAYKENLTGTPPIASIDYQTFAGSSVLLDPDRIDDFFHKVATGELTPNDFVKAP